MNLKEISQIASISASKFRGAKTQFLPSLLKTSDGLARITRFQSTELIVMTPERYNRILKASRAASDKDMDALRNRYKALLSKIEADASGSAFDKLLDASAEDISASVRVSRNR